MTTKLADYVCSASDSITLSDAAQRAGDAIHRTAADSLDLADIADRIVGHVRTVADSLGLAVVATRTVVLSRIAGLYLALTDRVSGAFTQGDLTSSNATAHAVSVSTTQLHATTATTTNLHHVTVEDS